MFSVIGQIAKWGLRTATVATQFQSIHTILVCPATFSAQIDIFMNYIIGLTELIAKAWIA